MSRSRPAACLALLLSAGSACDRTAPPPSAPVDPAPASRIRGELGEAALALVERADAAGAARMKVVAARQAELAAMTSDAVIGGYPIEAPLVALDPDTRARLLRRLLDDASYDYETARRCANDYFVGVRFQRGPERVEFNLGVRCMQAFWSLRDGDEVRRAGALLTDEAAAAVLELLADAGVRGARP